MFGSPAVTLEWQGAAGRQPEHHLVLRVVGLKRDRGGLFGLGRSPAMPGYLPDAHVITAEMAEGADRGARIRARVPGMIAEGITPGCLIALAMVDAKHAIGLLRPPAGLSPERIAAWVKAQTLG